MSDDWDTRRKNLEPKIEELLKFYLEDSCPCKFPRYRFVTGFFHRNYDLGPLLSLETEYLVYLSFGGKDPFLEETKVSQNSKEHDHISEYKCKKCGTKYTLNYNQYSINFDCHHFVIKHDDENNDKGRKIDLPVPLYGGLGGFDTKDVDKCMDKFKVGTLDEFIEYMKEKE